MPLNRGLGATGVWPIAGCLRGECLRGSPCFETPWSRFAKRAASMKDRNRVDLEH